MADLEEVSKVMASQEESDLEEKKLLLDLRDQGLNSIQLREGDEPTILILDNNNLSKLDGLEKCTFLTQFSACNNHIVRISGLQTLISLTVLSLSSNSIVAIEGLEELSQLKWLDLSSNSIKVIEHLPKGERLHYIDLSDNAITHLSDISHLESLKTLLLHSNNISSLKPAGMYLPKNLEILSLADNSVYNLNEISYLTKLANLKQMSIANNPCLLTPEEQQVFDYRPFILLWCTSLEIIDGTKVSEKERLQAEWLYTQGKVCELQQDGHQDLVDYLTEVFPTVFSQLRSEDSSKFSHLLKQQRKYRQHHRVSSPASSPRSQTSWYTHESSLAEDNPDVNSSHLSLDSDVPAGKHVWAEPAGVRKHLESPAAHASDIRLQDVTSDCETRSSVSLLDSDSVYLPFDVPSSPIEVRRPFTASDVPSKDEHAHLESSKAHLTRPHTATESRFPTFTKYDSLEQRPVRPLNQHVMKGYVKPSFDVARPPTSSSEPSVSTHKDSSLPTARSQDYESSSEQTASESEALSLKQLPSDSGQPPQHPTAHVTEHSRPAHAPQDKLNHIKTIAGSKKAVYHNSYSQREKFPPFLNVATKIKSPGSHFTQHGGAEENTFARSGSPDKLVKDTKEIKGKLNIERLEKGKAMSKKIAVSSLATDPQLGHKAATLIQAFWRGYWAREHNTKVVSVRKEIRARRAEDHIILLRKDLERNRQLYEKEKRMRVLQMEAIRLLYHEVQVLKSQSLSSSKDLNNSSTNYSPLVTAIPSSAILGSTEGNRTQELERTCQSLQNQVSQLQETLASVSSAVFKTNSFDSFDLTDNSDNIQITPFNEDARACGKPSYDETKYWSLIPNSLSPYPSEEEELYFQMVSVPGAPTPPRCLKLQHHSPTSVVLSWKPSTCGNGSEQEGNKHILGYKVFVNDKLKAFIHQGTSVLLEGLNSALTYKFYVKALSGFADSLESNILTSKLARGSERMKHTPTTESSVDSDAEEADKSKQRRRSRRYQRPDTKKSSQWEEVSKNVKYNNLPTDIFTHPKIHKHRHGGKGQPSQEAQNDLSQGSVSDVDKQRDKKLSQSPTYRDPSRHATDTAATEVKPLASESSEILASQNLRLSPCRKESPPSGSDRPAQQIRKKDQEGSKVSPVSGTAGARVEELLAKVQSPSMSETFTIEKASSFIESIHAIAEQNLGGLTFGSPSSGHKGHRRTRSRDLDKVSPESGGNTEGYRDSSNVDENSKGFLKQKKSKGSEGDVGSDSSSKSHGHRRQRSKDLNIAADIQEEKDQCKKDETRFEGRLEKPDDDAVSNIHGEGMSSLNKPVIDGRHRHSSGSRPSSPVVSIASSEERPRMSIAEQLIERNKINKLKENSRSVDSKFETNRRSSSNESISSAPGDSSKRSPSADSFPENSREEIEHTAESKQAGHAGQGRKSQSVNQNVMSRDAYLLPSMEGIKKDLQSHRRSTTDDKDGEVSSRPPSDDEKRSSRSRNLSESDAESLSQLPPKAAHENSSGSHSDDSRQTTRPSKHQRSPSDHWHPQTDSSQLTHSPIIMEGGVKKSGASVRRNQSFHGLLPSKHQDAKSSTSNEENSSKCEDPSNAVCDTK